MLEKFHRRMCSRYPELKSEIGFPKKLIRGNFKPYNLMRRTEIFGTYFSHILNGKNFKYRNSDILRNFLIGNQRHRYRNALQLDQYEREYNHL